MKQRFRRPATTSISAGVIIIHDARDGRRLLFFALLALSQSGGSGMPIRRRSTTLRSTTGRT